MHPSTIHAERVYGEEIQEKAVIWLVGIRNVLGEIRVCVDLVERRRIELCEARVGVFAVQTFLVTINPGSSQIVSE